MNFCSVCASPVEVKIPPLDHLPRHVCPRCGAIHYRNPRLVVGALPVWQDRILLCRRAITPRRGLWTLPAGFMENGESLGEAAIRETREEAGAEIELGPLLLVVSLPRIDQVHVFHHARLLSTSFCPGPESLEVALFSEHDLPWEQIAFPSVALALRRFFSDRARGCFSVYNETLVSAELMTE
ncbi:MAG: NUDIX hydrolase [Rhodocyclaceae bacterium]|nr:NUDIX hydrolase [Rhodocyclaceae bacterium]